MTEQPHLTVVEENGIRVVEGRPGLLGMISGLGGALAVLVWWAFFSRAPWAERLGAIVLMIVGLAGT
jgi:hypothetical protein